MKHTRKRIHWSSVERSVQDGEQMEQGMQSRPCLTVSLFS